MTATLALRRHVALKVGLCTGAFRRRPQWRLHLSAQLANKLGERLKNP